MATTALVGRGTQMSVLQTFCRRSDPSGASLLLVGPTGVGKTALLRAIAEWAAGENFSVLCANGVRAERSAEFSTLNQLLLPLECWLPRLQPDDQRALSEALGLVDGSSPESGAVASATSSLLRLAAEHRPVLLVADDLQWVDRSSAEVLALLIPRLDDSGTKLIGASRAHGTGFFDRRTMPRTPVLPLEPAAAAELITRHFPEVDRRVLPRLLAQSGGNPLALLELPRVLDTNRGDVLQPAGAARPLGRQVTLAFTPDIKELPPETRRHLLLLALDGTGDPRVCGGASSPAELAPAVLAGLVSLDPETQRPTFNHPLIAPTVIGLATGDDRRTAHGELAQLLVSRPERHVLHLAEAVRGPDDGAAAQLDAAAALMAGEGDATGAVALYRRSAALSANLADRAGRLVHAAHLSVAAAGQVTTGLDLLEEATRSDPPITSSLRYAMVLSAAALHGRGDADTAHRVLTDALDSHLARPEADRGTLVEALHDLLDLCRWTQRAEHRESLCDLLTELGGEEGAVLRLQVATLLDPLLAPGNAFDDGGAELQRPLPGDHQAVLVRIAECAIPAGRFSRYRGRLEAVVAAGRDRDGTAAAIDALCCLAQDAFSTGDWDRARLLVDEGLSWCDRLGYPLRAWTLRWVSALVDGGRGGLPAVRQSADEMLQWGERHGMGRVCSYAHHARALAALGSAQFELAYREATAITPADRQPPLGPVTLDQALCVVEAALHTSRGDEAARQAEVLRAVTTGGSSPHSSFLVAAATAMAATEHERSQLFERALAEPDPTSHPFDLARTHLAYGQHLRRSRCTTAARVHLRAASGLFERLQAWPWVEQTRIELAATGETRNQSEPGRSLTPQERTVALLAAAGHTNKQVGEQLFLTHRTVSAHLHQVFRKLGVDSRAALRDALDVQAGGSPPPGSASWPQVSGHQAAGGSRRPGHPVSTASAPR